MIPVFITGTGTDVGKTIASVVVANALGAGYWKPVQAGNVEPTDLERVRELLHADVPCFTEAYHLALPASPHLAAAQEHITISMETIIARYQLICEQAPGLKYLVIEGAGGLLVPFNDHEFVTDLIASLQAKVILVSRNYLGSINHSLLTAEACRQRNLDVQGWIFNDAYMDYQDDIARWSGYPVIGTIPKLDVISRETLYRQSCLLRERILYIIESTGAC